MAGCMGSRWLYRECNVSALSFWTRRKGDLGAAHEMRTTRRSDRGAMLQRAIHHLRSTEPKG
jgi:hypothetical protein